MLLVMIHSVFWWRCVFDLLETFVFRNMFHRDLSSVFFADIVLQRFFGRFFSDMCLVGIFL